MTLEQFRTLGNTQMVDLKFIRMSASDLRESGHTETAQDFMDCVREIESLRRENRTLLKAIEKKRATK
jgi:hypothetical protein